MTGRVFATAVDGYVELALAPLDRLRARALGWATPLSSALAAAREPRVGLLASTVVGGAALLTVLAPLWVLALGPIVLGVPHLLADLRYCAVRPGWSRERALWLTAGAPLLAIAAGAGFEIGLLGAAASVLVLPGDVRRRLAVAASAVVLAAWAWRSGSLADLVLAHAHNFIAVALWLAWRPRVGRHHWLAIGLFGLFGAALLLGLADAAITHMSSGLPTRLDQAAHVRALAPGLAQPWAIRLVLLFCFAQSVHYGVWLRLVPEDDRARPTPRSFRASYRALRDDFPGWVLGLAVLAAIGLAGWACADLVAARNGYFRFARFHGSLELIAAALLLAQGRRPAQPRESP